MTEPRTVEQALAWLRSGHLAPDPNLPQLADRDRRAQQVATCFAAHPEVLQTILQMSVFRPPVDHRLAPGEYEHYAQLRMGQDQLAAGILSYIDHAQQQQRADHERRPDQPDPHADGSGGSAAGFSDGAVTDPNVAVR